MSLFHERLRELKSQSGKTQKEIAEALHISPQALSNYMKTRMPDYDTLIRLADYFSITLDYLLGREEQPAFGDAYIHRQTGLGEESISALKDMKRILDEWDGAHMELYNAMTRKLLDALTPYVDEGDWERHEDMPRMLREYGHHLPEAKVRAWQAMHEQYKRFRTAAPVIEVLNRIIRTDEGPQADPAAYAFLNDLHYYLLNINFLHEQHEAVMNMFKTMSYDDARKALQSFTERALLNTVNELRRSICEERGETSLLH